MTFPVSVALCMGAWVGGVCVAGVGGVWCGCGCGCV